MKSIILISTLMISSAATAGDYYYARHQSSYRWSLFGGVSGSREGARILSNDRTPMDAEVSASYASSYGESRSLMNQRRLTQRSSGERGSAQIFILNAFTRALGVKLPNIDIGYAYDLSRTATKGSEQDSHYDLYQMQTNAASVRVIGRSLHTSALYLKYGFTSLSGTGLSDGGQFKLMSTRGVEADLYLISQIGINASSLASSNDDGSITARNDQAALFVHASVVKISVGYNRTAIDSKPNTVRRDAGVLSLGVVL